MGWQSPPHVRLRSYFECNYSGSDASFMDELFGTFRSSFKCGLRRNGRERREGGREGGSGVEDARRAIRPTPASPPRRPGDKGPNGAAARVDAKATLWGAPSPSFVAYLALAGACLGAWAYAAAPATPLPPAAAAALAILAGFGPIAAAVALSALSGVERGAGSAPEGAASVALHASLGTLFCAVPIAWAAYITLRPAPGAAA